MFTVGFDISALDPAFKQHASRGIGRYVRELKRYFDGFRHDVIEIDYFSHTDLLSGSKIKPLLARLPAGAITVGQQLVYPTKLAQRDDWSMAHFPAHMDGPSWGPKRRIVTVLDLIPLVLQDIYRQSQSSFRFKFARFLENRAIKSATHLIAISECTKRDIVRMLGVPEERITVTPLGVDERFFYGKLLEDEIPFRARLRIPLDRPIVAYVGGIDQRKNLHWMLKVWRAVIDTIGASNANRPVLCLAGDIKGDKQFPALVSAIETLGLSRDVVMPGFINDEDLLQLFSISKIFFFPSLYEGFGLPPLEAMAAGLPVVTLNTSSIPEVVGSCAELIAPNDEVGAVKSIIELLQNKTLRSERSELGRAQAAKFTWQKTGESTFRVYERMSRGV